MHAPLYRDSEQIHVPLVRRISMNAMVRKMMHDGVGRAAAPPHSDDDDNRATALLGAGFYFDRTKGVLINVTLVCGAAHARFYSVCCFLATESATGSLASWTPI